MNDSAQDTGNNPDTITQTVSSGTTPSSSRRKVLLIIAIGLILLGTGTGVFLVGRQQFTNSFAWDCPNYKYSVSKDGLVSLSFKNTTHFSNPRQDALVYIDEQLVSTISHDKVEQGQELNIGSVTVPTEKSFSWRVEGSKDCVASGRYTFQVTRQCDAIRAYDTDWSLLTAAQLSQLKAGDHIYLTVAGSVSSGSLDRARFSINSQTVGESTLKHPNSPNEFALEYTIPSGITSFNIGAEIHHDTTDTWQ